MKFNPAAITFWTFTTIVAYAIYGTGQAAATGAAIGLGISLLIELLL